MANETILLRDILARAAGSSASMVSANDEGSLIIRTTVKDLAWELEAYVGDLEDEDDNGTWMNVDEDGELDQDATYRFVADFGRFAGTVRVEPTEIIVQDDDEDESDPDDDDDEDMESVILEYTDANWRQAFLDMMEVTTRVSAAFTPSRN